MLDDRAQDTAVRWIEGFPDAAGIETISFLEVTVGDPWSLERQQDLNALLLLANGRKLLPYLILGRVGEANTLV